MNSFQLYCPHGLSTGCVQMNVDITVYRARIGKFMTMRKKNILKHNYIASYCASIRLSHIFLKMYECIDSMLFHLNHLLILIMYLGIIICPVLLVAIFLVNTRIPFRLAPFRNSVFIFWEFLNIAFSCSCIIQLLLFRSGIEVNPGPTKVPGPPSQLSFCHWNVDGILARDGIKISYIESILENYSFDIFAVGESSLSGKVPDEKLRANGYTSPLSTWVAKT